jgi:hypothetical protein
MLSVRLNIDNFLKHKINIVSDVMPYITKLTFRSSNMLFLAMTANEHLPHVTGRNQYAPFVSRPYTGGWSDATPEMAGMNTPGRGPGANASVGLDESRESPQKGEAKIKGAPELRDSFSRQEADSDLQPIVVKAPDEIVFARFENNMLFFLTLLCACALTVTKFVRGDSEATKWRLSK